jgi:uncharacterized membrane protein
MTETAGPTGPAGGGDITSDDKLWALLAYVTSGLFGIIILLMADKKARPFLKYHAVQSLLYGVPIVWVVGGILAPFTCGIATLVLWAVGIYFGWKAYQGEWVTIPVLTDLGKGQGWM